LSDTTGKNVTGSELETPENVREVNDSHFCKVEILIFFITSGIWKKSRFGMLTHSPVQSYQNRNGYSRGRS
jgi:hypothetical protein